MELTAQYPPEVKFNHPDGVVISSTQQPQGSLNGRFALVSNTGDSNVVHIDLASGSIEANYNGFGYPAGLALSADDSFALVCDPPNNRIGHIDIATQEVTWPFNDAEGFAEPYGVTIAPDGSFALVANYGANNIGRIDLESKTVTFPYAGASGKNGSVPSILSQPRDIAISPDATFALVANEGGGNVARIDLTAPLVPTPSKGRRGKKQKVDKTSMISFLKDVTLEDPRGVALSPQGVAFLTCGGMNDSSHVTTIDIAAIDGGGIVAMSTKKISGFNEAYSLAVAADGLFMLVCDYAANNLSMVELDASNPVSDKVKPPEPVIPKTREEIIAEKMEAWSEARRLEKEEQLQEKQRRQEAAARRAERKARLALLKEVRARVELVGNIDVSSMGPTAVAESYFGGIDSPSTKSWEIQYDALQGWRRKPSKQGEYEAYSTSLQRSAEQVWVDILSLREAFERSSPVATGISIPEAWRRMSRFEEALAQIDRVNEMVEAGEQKLLGEGNRICEDRIIELEDMRQRLDVCRHIFKLAEGVAESIENLTSFARGTERQLAPIPARATKILTLTDTEENNAKEYALLPSGKFAQQDGRHSFNLDQHPPAEVFVIPEKENIPAFKVQEIEEPTAVVALCHVPAVLVFGAIGANKSKINGIFFPTGVVVNKRELLKKKRLTSCDPDIVLRFSSEARWEIVCTEPEMMEDESDDNESITSSKSDSKQNLKQQKYTGELLTTVVCQSVEQDLMNPCDAIANLNGAWKLMLSANGKLSDPFAGIMMSAHVEPILITGATGAVASKVNGIFKPTGQIYNGKPLLVMMNGGMKVSWLRFVIGERNAWMVSGLTDKNANSDGGYLLCTGESAHLVDDPANTSDQETWCVLSQDGKNMISQSYGVKVARHVAAVLLAGATGTNAPKINGAFEPTGEAQNGFEILRKKEDPDMWLRCDAAGNWTISNTADKDANNGNCVGFATKQGVLAPIDAKVWKVYDGSGRFERQPIKTTYPMPLVIVEGCTGSYSSKVNGVYHPTGEIYNGKELLVQYYDPNIYMRYVTANERNTWVISNSNDKEENNVNGYCWCAVNDVHNPVEPHPSTGAIMQWYVRGAKYPDPKLTVREYLDPPPPLKPVVFEKCTTVPYYKVINGTYRPTGLNYNGKELFRKVQLKASDGDIWLHYQTRDKSNDWRVTEELGNELRERCISKEKNLTSPAHAKHWLCKTEYQSGGFEEGNSKMVCKYQTLTGDRKEKAEKDALRHRLGGKRPRGIDRSASKVQEAGGGRAVHDVAVSRDNEHVVICEFLPGGIYRATRDETGSSWNQMLEELNMIEGQAMLSANQGKHALKHKKGGGCSNYRLPPLGTGDGSPLTSEERQDLCETFDQHRQACSNSFVSVYSNIRHSTHVPKRVLHYESAGKAIHFTACTMSGDNEYVAAIADNLMVIWDWAQKTPEGGWTSKVLVQTKTNSGSEKLQQELRVKRRALNELSEKVDYFAGKIDTAQRELDALEEAVAEAEAKQGQIEKEANDVKKVIEYNQRKATTEISKLHMEYMNEFRRPLNSGGSLPPSHKGMVKILMLLLKTEEEKVEEKIKNEQAVATGQEPKLEPTDRDMANFLSNAANLRCRCQEFEMTLNKFEVKACDGMLKQLSPENDFERDMKVRSSTPGDRIQMDSCKRASEEARKLACWIRGVLEVSLQGEILKQVQLKLSEATKAASHAQEIAESSPHVKSLDLWQSEMRKLEAKYSNAEKAVKDANLELEMQKEDVNRVAFHPHDRSCITTSGAALKQWTLNIQKRQIVPRDLKVEGSICDHIWLSRAGESDIETERLVALARVENEFYNLVLFNFIRGRLEYGGSQKDIFEISAKNDVFRDLLVPIGSGYIAAHLHQSVQVGRSQTCFAYSQNGKTLDWSLRVDTPGLVVFVSVAAKPSENMLVAYTASEEMYCARLDDILSEENKIGAIDIHGKSIRLTRIQRPYYRAAGAKAEGGRVNGADEFADGASSGAGNPIEKIQELLDEVCGLADYFDTMIAEGLMKNILKDQILRSSIFGITKSAAASLLDKENCYLSKFSALESVKSFIEYWHQPACTWTDFQWDYRRMWHLEFLRTKILTVSTEQLEDDILKKMLMMVDELVARKPGSALKYFKAQLDCIFKCSTRHINEADDTISDESVNVQESMKTNAGMVLEILTEFSAENFTENARTISQLNPWYILREAFSIQRELCELKVRDIFELDWAQASRDRERSHLLSFLKDVILKVKIYRRKKEKSAQDIFPGLTYQTESGNVEGLKKLVNSNLNSLTCTDEEGRTLLHLAVRHGQTDAVAFLVQHAGIPINRANKKGETPLYCACRYGRMGIIRFLLDHSAETHIADCAGNTPLHIAAMKNKKEVATILLEYGAAMDQRNGWVASLKTPGDAADQLGYTGMSQLLHQFVGTGDDETDERILEEARALELENEFAFGASSVDAHALVVPLSKKVRSIAQSSGGVLNLDVGTQMFVPEDGIALSNAEIEVACLDARVAPRLPKMSKDEKEQIGLSPVIRFRSTSKLRKQCIIEFPIGGDPLLAKNCGDTIAAVETKSIPTEGHQLILWRRRQANSKWEIVSKNEYNVRSGRVQMYLRSELPYQITTSFEQPKTTLQQEMLQNGTASRHELSVLCFTDPKPQGENEAFFVVWAVPNEPMARKAVVSKMLKQHPSPLHFFAESSERLLVNKKTKLVMTVSNQAPISKTYISGSSCRFDVPDPGLSAHQKSVPITVEDAENPQNKATLVLTCPRTLAPPFPPTVAELASRDGKPFSTVALTRPLNNVTYDVRYKVLDAGIVASLAPDEPFIPSSTAIKDDLLTSNSIFNDDIKWQTAWSMRDDYRLDHTGKYAGNQFIIPCAGAGAAIDSMRSPLKSELGSPFGGKSRGSELGKFSEDSGDDETLTVTDYSFVGKFLVQTRAINAFGVTQWSASCIIGRPSTPELLQAGDTNHEDTSEDSLQKAQKIIDRCMLLADTARVYPLCASTLKSQLAATFQRCRITATSTVHKMLSAIEALLERCSAKGWLAFILIPPSPSWVHEFKQLGEQLLEFEFETFNMSKFSSMGNIEASPERNSPMMPKYVTEFGECPQWRSFARQQLVTTIVKLGAQHGRDTDAIVDNLQSRVSEFALDFDVEAHEMELELQHSSFQSAVQTLACWMQSLQNTALSPVGGAVGLMKSSSLGTFQHSPLHRNSSNNHRENKLEQKTAGTDTLSRNGFDATAHQSRKHGTSRIGVHRSSSTGELHSPKKMIKNKRSRISVYISGVICPDDTLMSKIQMALFERGIRVFTSCDMLTAKVGKRGPSKRTKLEVLDEALLQSSMFVPIITSSYGCDLRARYTSREFLAANRFRKHIVPIIRLSTKENMIPSIKHRIAQFGQADIIESPPPPPSPPLSTSTRHKQPIISEPYDEDAIFSSTLEGILNWATTLNVVIEEDPIEDSCATEIYATNVLTTDFSIIPHSPRREKSRDNSQESEAPEDTSTEGEETSEVAEERLAREQMFEELQNLEKILDIHKITFTMTTLQLFGIKSPRDLDICDFADDDFHELIMEYDAFRALMIDVKGRFKSRRRRAIDYRSLDNVLKRVKKYSGFGILNHLTTPVDIQSEAMPNSGEGNPPVILIDGAWLSKFANGLLFDKQSEEEGNPVIILPRRQDLEREHPEAIYTGPIYENVTVLVVSCCWVSRCHCDSNGKQLQDLCKVIDWYLKDAERTGVENIAVFWDFMSMYQHDTVYSHARIVAIGRKDLIVKNEAAKGIKRWNISVRFHDASDDETVLVPYYLIKEYVEALDAESGDLALSEALKLGHSIAVRKPRSPSQEKLFALAMNDIEVWFSSKCTTKLLLTYLPDDMPATDERPEYNDSGWLTFERFAADMLSSVSRVIDVAKLKYDESHWEEMSDVKQQLASYSNRGRRSFKDNDAILPSNNFNTPQKSAVPQHARSAVASYGKSRLANVARDFQRFAFARMNVMKDQGDLVNSGKHARYLPITPEAFNELMDCKIFFNPVDRLQLKKKYAVLFRDIGLHNQWKLDNISASASTWRTFLDSVLKNTHTINFLNVADNKALDIPLEELASLECLKGLKVLLINETSLRGDIQVLRKLEQLEVVDISGCPHLFGITTDDNSQVFMTDKVQFRECVETLQQSTAGRCRITWETPPKDVKTILKSSVRKINSIRRAASRRSFGMRRMSSISPSNSLSP